MDKIATELLNWIFILAETEAKERLKDCPLSQHPGSSKVLCDGSLDTNPVNV